MNNQSIKFPTDEEIKKYIIREGNNAYPMREAIRWLRSEILRLNEPKEVKTKGEIKTAEEILDKHYQPRMHWKSVNRISILAAMEEYKNQSCQSQGGFTESDMEEFAEWIETKMLWKSTDKRFPATLGRWTNCINGDVDIEKTYTTFELLQLYVNHHAPK